MSLLLEKDEVLLLASQSPRRAELLSQAGIAFRVQPADIDENAIHGTSPEETVRLIAIAKAQKVASLQPPHTLILAADTNVVLQNTVLGKPSSLEEARQMLRLLSGKNHQVMTGVCLLRSGEELSAWTTISQVHFKPLTEETMTRYFSLVNPLDKAGGYAIQQYGDLVIDRYEGLLSNIIGLPIEEVRSKLFA